MWCYYSYFFPWNITFFMNILFLSGCQFVLEKSLTHCYCNATSGKTMFNNEISLSLFIIHYLLMTLQTDNVSLFWDILPCSPPPPPPHTHTHTHTYTHTQWLVNTSENAINTWLFTWQKNIFKATLRGRGKGEREKEHITIASWH